MTEVKPSVSLPLSKVQIRGYVTVAIDARALHRALASREDFSEWIKVRIEFDNYQENQDFILRRPALADGRLDYFLSIDMAKGIAMREESPSRTEVRKFLLEAERKTIFGKIATHRPTFDRQMEEIVAAELRRLVNIQLPPLLSEMIGDRRIQVRYGKTAGQIWKDKKYPPLNLSGWFGNQLAKGGCLVQGAVYGELGHSRARLFDPDKVDQWLAAGGKDLVKLKIQRSSDKDVSPSSSQKRRPVSPPRPAARAGCDARR